MARIKPWKLKAGQMAKQGKSITKISEELDVDWLLVHEYIRGKQGTAWSSWQGAKTYITYRLRKLAASDRSDERESLREEVADAVNYLYYAGRKLGKKLDSP